MFKQKLKNGLQVVSTLFLVGGTLPLLSIIPTVQAQTFEEIQQICANQFPIESDPQSIGYNECITRLQQERDVEPPTDNREPDYDANDCKEVTADGCGIIKYLVIFINILSALAGVAIAGSIAYGGIQYSMAGNDPQKVSAAKARIRNAIIALLFFIFGYGFLNFLVPGGLLR